MVKRVLRMFGNFLRGHRDSQPNHNLHHVRVLALMQPTVQKHEVSVLAFLLKFKCQNSIVYYHFRLKQFKVSVRTNIP
jgi:hypothetical protein